MQKHGSFTYEDPEKLFNSYLDSVKFFKSGMLIPQFFYNHLLDYEHPWLMNHHTWSIRKKIFDSTFNLQLLNLIVSSFDPAFKKIIDSITIPDKTLFDAIPYTNISNYELAKNRLLEIKTSGQH